MSTRLFHALALFLLAGCASARWRPDAADDPGKLYRFTRFPDVSTVKISPNGTYAAVLATPQGESRLLFIRVADRASVGGFDIDSRNAVLGMEWANDTRVVLELGVKQGGPLEVPFRTGEILAIDVDGRNPRMIFGEERKGVETLIGLGGGESNYQGGRLLGTLPSDPSRILVLSRTVHVERISGNRVMSQWTNGAARIFSVSVSDGRWKVVADSPGQFANYVTDETGALRFATTRSDEGVVRIFEFNSGSGEWSAAREPGVQAKNLFPIAVSKKRDLLYVVGEDDAGTAIFSLELGSGNHKIVARNKKVEPLSTLFDPSSGALVGVEFEPNYPSWTMLEKESAPAKIISGLLTKYAGHRILISSLTTTGSQAVARISSDRMPGLYVVADTNGTITPLISENENIVPDEMLPTEAFLLKASDGVELHGYLTLPRDGDKAPQAMVVMPHGGPHGIRDVWELDENVQAYAAAGYAVLRVNFRGSGGYGSQFLKSGMAKWGDRVIDDILDTVRWAIAERIADPKRICIAGNSFGGYAALQSAIRAPELFQCAVGIAGVYDLDLLFKEGDVQEEKWGRIYLADAVGTDPKARAAMSPAKNAEKLRIPVLLIHGEEDQRAPISHAKKMCHAIEEQNRICETAYYSDEGHGFWDEKNRFEAKQKELEFVGRYLRY